MDVVDILREGVGVALKLGGTAAAAEYAGGDPGGYFSGCDPDP